MKKSRAFALPVLLLCAAGAGAAPLMIAARSGRAPAAPAAPAAALELAPIRTRGGEVRGQALAPNAERPQYFMDLKLDWKLLSFQAAGEITVPVRAGESLREAVFFVFANAGGVGGADATHANIAFDSISLNNAAVPWKLDGAVLRVQLPQAQSSPFTLHFNWHGVIPRLPPSDGISDLMGGAGADLDGLLGGILGGGGGGGNGAGGAPKAAAKREENTDYGLYAFGSGVLSLGAFWYPTLAVRGARGWVDEAPRGLGDVAYADESDYSVTIEAPPQVLVAAPGEEGLNRHGQRLWTAQGVRDFAVLASDSFVRASRSFEVGGKSVSVEAFTTRAHAAKSAQAIDIAGRALQIYARRFGPYPRGRFAVVEGPLRAGAGGMEYSGMTAIASALYGDLQAQLGAMSGMAGGMAGGSAGGAGGDNKLNGLLGDLEKEAYGEASSVPQGAPQASGQGAQAGAASTSGGNPLAGLEGMGAAGDLLKQQGAIMGSLFEETIAHEAAHQWWAIGVGSDSQRAPWLDESLTNWSSMLYFEDRYSKARSAQMMEAHLKTAYALARMLGSADDRADKRTSDYTSNLQYGALVYGKGALFYARLRGLMGDAAFFAALGKYFADYNGRLSSGRALIDEFKRAEPGRASEIEALFARWIEGAHGDEDITGGAPPSLAEMLGQAMGGAGGAGGAGSE